MIDYFLSHAIIEEEQEVGIAFTPQTMHWSPMLADHDHDVATGLHSNSLFPEIYDDSQRILFGRYDREKEEC